MGCLILYSLWIVAGIVYFLWEMKIQSQKSQPEMPPNHWYEWIILFGVISLMAALVLIYEILCPIVYFVTFGRVDFY
jgi:hypothetical protein